MIKATFVLRDNEYIGFMFTGHANYAQYGYDIVCAGVTSAVMLTINTVSDFFSAEAKLMVDCNIIMLKLLNPKKDRTSQQMIISLRNHLKLLESEYENILVLDRSIQN